METLLGGFLVQDWWRVLVGEGESVARFAARYVEEQGKIEREQVGHRPKGLSAGGSR